MRLEASELRDGARTNPDDYVLKMLEVRGRLNEMSERISDERFEDILLQDLTVYQVLRNSDYDELSRPERRKSTRCNR